MVWSAVYDAFGSAEVGVDSVVGSNLRFPGQYYDQETGLHYNWNRYYDVETGRYLTVDPIGFDGGNNLFIYANQNPIRFTDPRGLLVDPTDNFNCIQGCQREFGAKMVKCAQEALYVPVSACTIACLGTCMYITKNFVFCSKTCGTICGTATIATVTKCFLDAQKWLDGCVKGCPQPCEIK